MFDTRTAQLLPMALSESGVGYCYLAKLAWRRKRGGYVRRLLLRTRFVKCAAQGTPMVSNTSCKALLSQHACGGAALLLPT